MTLLSSVNVVRIERAGALSLPKFVKASKQPCARTRKAGTRARPVPLSDPGSWSRASCEGRSHWPHQVRSMLPEFGRRASLLCGPGRIDRVCGRTTAVHAAFGSGPGEAGTGRLRPEQGRWRMRRSLPVPPA